MKTGRLITDEDILYILKADVLSLPQDLADEVGIARDTVRHIRKGTLHSDVYPGVKRVPLVSRNRGCGGCKLWKPSPLAKCPGSCKLAIKDAEEHGAMWGYQCSFFSPLDSEVTPEQRELITLPNLESAFCA